MNKLQEEFKDSIYMNGSKDDGKYSLTLSQLDQVGKESAQITTDVAIEFAKWRTGTMYDKEKGIDGKSIIRENPDNYWEKLFEYFINNVYGK